MAILRIYFIAMLIFPSFAYAFTCNEMPAAVTSVNSDVKNDVEVSIGKLGPVSASQISSKTEVTAKNLYDKYPSIDKLLLSQTMISTYCSMLKESSLDESEKIDRWEKFQDKVLNLKPGAPADKTKLESFLKFGFDRPYSEIAANVSLESNDNGKQFIRFTQTLIGKNFEVAQGLQSGKTAMSRFWRSIAGSYSEYDNKHNGATVQSVSDECSKENFNQYVSALSTSLGTPKNISPERSKSEQDGNASYDTTTRGSFWHLISDEKALLYFKRTQYWGSEKRSGSTYSRNSHRCEIQFCAIPAGYDKVCFEIPGIVIT
jgi:hypothetical protein